MKFLTLLLRNQYKLIMLFETFQLRRERNQQALESSLDAITQCAEGKTDGNLLDLAVKAVRARASVEEITYAMEKVLIYLVGKKCIPLPSIY